jgi:hypothetical protein
VWVLQPTGSITGAGEGRGPHYIDWVLMVIRGLVILVNMRYWVLMVIRGLVILVNMRDWVVIRGLVILFNMRLGSDGDQGTSYTG